MFVQIDFFLENECAISTDGPEYVSEVITSKKSEQVWYV